MDLNAALTSSSNVMSSTKNFMSKLSDDVPTMHRRNVSFQAPSFPVTPPFWNKMESILQKVGLSTLSKRFADEKIDPCVILEMSDSCLMRLGVETLGDCVHLKENCRQFADGERRTNVASRELCRLFSSSAVDRRKKEAFSAVQQPPYLSLAPVLPYLLGKKPPPQFSTSYETSLDVKLCKLLSPSGTPCNAKRSSSFLALVTAPI